MNETYGLRQLERTLDVPPRAAEMGGAWSKMGYTSEVHVIG